ncbi:beta-galactosidase [Tessaracoccus antarcticus]|uniref:Uncharacterized protein n=1 Tax=Tessaracoccus antarcticus TaxID=2479848 RepID=A0A3M0GFW3_9ACTN|nr:beta-galactosidase [Tessaracoccus antarcticus]RMB61592.1 hypothetical protein EAX62_02875 [Tessaracoccus antarcticus]
MTFEVADDGFRLDGDPFQVISGSLHYFRVHPDLWEDRLIKARQLGLNTIDTYVGVRGRGTSGSGGLDTTPYALKMQDDGAWQFLRRGAVVANGSAATTGWDPAAWHRLSVRAAGAHITGSIDGDEVFSYTDPNPYLAGFVDLASGFHYTQFDNLRVEQVEGHLPHYGEHLDNMEMNDLAADPAPKLVFDGTWSHRNGLGSTSSSAHARRARPPAPVSAIPSPAPVWTSSPATATHRPRSTSTSTATSWPPTSPPNPPTGSR